MSIRWEKSILLAQQGHIPAGGQTGVACFAATLEMDRPCTGCSERQPEESNGTILVSRTSEFHAKAEGAAVFCQLYVHSDTRRWDNNLLWKLHL